MTELQSLIAKHRAAGLLIDSNLLVLLLIGRAGTNRIQTSKRTSAYTIKDYELLEELVCQFRQLQAIPQVLTETDDLVKNDVPGFRDRFRDFVGAANERLVEGRAIVSAQDFSWMGFADIAVALSASGEILVLTDDLGLYDALRRRGVDAINFNHIRTAA